MKYLFSLAGSGADGFPLDMLRFDRCLPATQEDSHMIARVLRNEITGSLVLRFGGTQEPTVARWLSFGWRVLEVKTND